MANPYPGYNIINNEALQTGVHCGDIAIHMDSLRRETDAIKSLVNNYNQPPNENVLMNSENILNQIIQAKRRELCEFAIEKISQTNADGETWRRILSSELKKTIIEFYNSTGRDGIQDSMVKNPVDENSPEFLPNFINALEDKIDDLEYDFEKIFEDPELGVAYIEDYYLHGNNEGDDPFSSRMFKVPEPGSSGMMDFAAALLKRPIIVINAKNGEPYQSISSDEYNPNPIYIGYNGSDHFVELRPLTIDEMYEIVQKKPTEEDEKIEQAIVRGKLYLALEPQNTDVKELIQRAATTYAAINSKKDTLNKDETKFKKNHQLKEIDIDDFYEYLLKMQITWINDNTKASSEEKEHQRKRLIGTMIDFGISKQLATDIQQLIARQADRKLSIISDSIALAGYINELNSLKLNIEPKSPVIDKNYEPFVPLETDVSEYKPSRDNSIWGRIKNFLSNVVAVLLYPFKWVIKILTASATPIPANPQNADEVQKIFTIPYIAPSDLADDVLALTSQLRDYFANNYDMRNKLEQEQILVKWQDIMDSIKNKNYLEFCQKVESLMQEHPTFIPPKAKTLTWARHLELEQESDPNYIQRQAQQLAKKVKPVPPI